MKRWRRTASVGGSSSGSSLPSANVTAVVLVDSFTVNWVFDSMLDASGSPWTNLDGFLVNGEQTLSAAKIDDFTIEMAYLGLINPGDPWVCNASPPTNVIFDPPRALQNGSGVVS